MKIDWLDIGISYKKAIEISNYFKDYETIVLSKHYETDFFDFETEYPIWYGSRVSAKSYVKAVQLLYKASTQKYFRGLFTRETQKDARESQYQLFEDLITKIYPFLQDEFILETSKMRVTHKNGNFLKGASFENLPRSLAEYTDFWVDEPITRKSSISRTDLLDISGTLRNSFGMKSQKHLTFNPISKTTFIYTDFFGENKLFDTKVLLCNYQHNVFCPPEKIKELEWYKDIDLQRYLVDSLGQWGDPKPDDPFFTALKDYNFGSVTYNPKKPVWISWDFNKNSTAIVAQRYDEYEPCRPWGFKHEGIGALGIIEEYQVNSIGDEAFMEMAKNLFRKYKHEKIFITGDRSGKQTGAGRLSAYVTLQRALVEIGLPEDPNYFEFIGIAGSNLPHDISRIRCNFALNYYKENFIIDESCTNLWSDMNRMETDGAGGLNKKLMENSNPRFGDHGDTIRYLIATAENNRFLTI